MESIKTAFAQRIDEAYGEHVLQLDDTKDVYFKLCLLATCPDYVLYFRPNSAFTECTCYYALRADLQACESTSAELRGWKQQRVFQFVRRVRCGKKEDGLMPMLLAWIRDAVDRIDRMQDVGLMRGAFVRPLTFEEAKLEAKLYPRPRAAAKILPPPVCRRHGEVHREAEKRKKRRRKDDMNY